MQTFLPYPDLIKSAQCLDDKRLGNQRREALSILSAIKGETTGWAHHPATLMWTGYSSALRLYYDAIVAEWIRRGFTHNGVRMKIHDSATPWWLGDERLHASHRAVLMSKEPGWYRQFGWSEEPGTSYYWPVRKNAEGIFAASERRVIK